MPSNANGKLIVIEGIEGAGKSTAVNVIVDILATKGIPYITTREPGGTEIGEILRSIIKDPANKHTLDNRSELLLMYVSRIQLLEQVIKPTLKQGVWVIADRFEMSTFAYQGGGRGLDVAMIQQLSNFCLQGFKPDLTIYLDISPELGMQRAQTRGQFDRIEQQSIDFFHRIYDSYQNLLKNAPDIIQIDASPQLDRVKLSVEKAITQYIEQL
ncbi:dTMP kinase [Legionella waltersii]|uniref:Thymidylate kinase n=1 Tax=Legionella waltersii TaxID=66969 RepID=A0A0W1ALR7_9GAMM|nr:dTMP kinase [Legionella waltersii]KTD82301.1 thymidylate kinase [Legionella waltersii]SNV04169.1 dTMP kinase [Legionella waltersii]